MNVANLWLAFTLSRRLRDYRPLPVTFTRVTEWFDQFPKNRHSALRAVLRSIRYFPEAAMLSDLKALNERLLAKLATGGVTPERVIYASFDDAGSSSAAILNLLRDTCGLESRKCRFVDAGNVRKLNELTSSIGSGAIVYVDDFIGTGNQFSKNREFASQYIIGTFSEFLLVHTICEEGIGELARRGAVQPLSARVHSRQERPLHEFATLLTEDDKEALRRYCMGLHHVQGLGFRKLATMVVYYRNSPNTVPLLIRGSRGQAVCRGILPRTTDLDAA